MSDAVDHEGDVDVESPPIRRVAPWIAGGVAVVMIGLIGVLMMSGGDVASTAATPLLDRAAPDVSGTTADGEVFSLSRRKGSWVVLNFFAPDCIPCIDEHPDLVRFVDQQRSLGSEGAEFYSIVQHASPEEVDEFFDTYGGGDWSIIYDDEFEFQTQFGVAQVPETWVIDPNGVVRGRVIGRIASADSLSTELQLLRERFGGTG